MSRKRPPPPTGAEAPAERRTVIAAIAFYCACSSSLLFLNKVVVSSLGIPPGCVVLLQLSFATMTCVILRATGTTVMGAFEARKVKLFSLYVFAFVGSIYSSVMALRYSNVETFIVFRACTPLAVSVLDSVFLRRALPSRRSTLALLSTAAFAVFYVSRDAQFVVEGFQGYSWCASYFALICFEMTFGKHLVSSLRLGVWESVFLTNVLALPILCCLALVRGELTAELASQLSSLSALELCLLLASCLVATLIGYAGWRCRGLVSATSYTLIGVANKLGTVLLAVVFLEKHATPLGVCALVGCIASSSQYTQSPLRSDLLKANHTLDAQRHPDDGAAHDDREDALNHNENDNEEPSTPLLSR